MKRNEILKVIDHLNKKPFVGFIDGMDNAYVADMINELIEHVDSIEDVRESLNEIPISCFD